MIELTGEELTIEDLVAIARDGAHVVPLGEAAQARMERSHAWVDESIRQGDEAIYGVNTGFGSLATQRIAPEEAQKLSRNVILACSSSVLSRLYSSTRYSMLPNSYRISRCWLTVRKKQECSG